MLSESDESEKRLMLWKIVIPGLAWVWIGTVNLGIADAAWTLIDDFESLMVSTAIHGENNWFAENDNSANDSRLVAVDPADAGNKVVDIYSGGSSDMSHPIFIDSNASATIYGRFYIPALTSAETPNQGDLNLGAAQIDPPEGADPNVGPSYRIVWNGSASTHQLQMRNADNSDWNVAASLEVNTWYQLWMTLDNEVDTYSGNIQGGAFATQTQLAPGNTHRFRGAFGSTNPLITLAIRMNIAHEGNNLLIDDFYYQVVEEGETYDLSVPEVPLLKVVVHPVTGEIVLANLFSDPIEFDSYQINSSQSALLPANGNWNSLDDQGYDAIGGGVGQSWDESGNSSATAIAERFLLGSSTLEAGEVASIGTAYNPAVGDANMTLRYRDVLQGSTRDGRIEFALLGDMNGDGDVNELDIPLFIQALTNRAAFEANPNATSLDADFIGDFDGNGLLDVGDVGAFSTEVGSTSMNSSAVPEPTCWILLISILLGLGTHCRFTYVQNV